MMNKKANNVMIKSPSYGRHFNQWHAACPVPWQAYTQHGFVAGLGDGSLPLTSFLHYLRQDYIFLIHFLSAWALAIVKASDLEEMKAAPMKVFTLIHDEKQVHVSICAAEGISKDELYNTHEALQDIAYTRYVLEGDFLDLLTALAPCVMYCGKIDIRRAASKPACDNGDQINDYASDEYQALCRDVVNLIDNAITTRLGANPIITLSWQVLCDWFRTATKLEVNFWQMGLNR